VEENRMSEKCFALDSKEACKVLSVDKCSGNSCSFYKTREQYLIDRRASLDLISKKPLKEQLLIAGKYYSGDQPWNRSDGHQKI
jgi:hypothetical protein